MKKLILFEIESRKEDREREKTHTDYGSKMLFKENK